MADRRRDIPSTAALLGRRRFTELAARLGHSTVKAAITDAQTQAREGRIGAADVGDVAARALAQPGSVINATGVLLHTNLGRAPLSQAALDALVTAAGYTDVEFDLDSGLRAARGRAALAALAAAVPGAGAAHVVNNNAAALLLCAMALAPGREIVVSRGELVEIGDGFRIPDLLTAAGARLREVGTTNRTSLRDYADAIGPDTGFVLTVHPSNYRITGFTSRVPLRRLAALPVPVVADIGSGLLAPDPRLPGEPDAATTLRHGAGLVTASADKLLGGPQAGILLGSADLVRRVSRHPAARAMRAGKLTLAALAATLRGPAPPVARMLAERPDELARRALRIAEILWASGVAAEVVECASVVGGGAAPGVTLDSRGVSVPARYAAPLRSRRVVGRTTGERCVLDLRTVDPADDQLLADAIAAVHRDLTCR